MALGGLTAGGGGIGAVINQRRYNQGPQSYTPEGAYQGAVPTQAGNYDEIMQGYRNILGGSGNNDYSSILSKYNQLLNSPESQYQPAQYSNTSEFNTAFGNATNLANNGGLSESDQQNLRARGISPIRAIYANAQRGLDRQRSLSGGYSPNYGAVSSRMARELSEQIGGATTNVNAEIAKMVQEGRLRAAPIQAQLAGNQNELSNRFSLENASNANRAATTRAGLLEGMSNIVGQRNRVPLEALQGMTSLYGTTPALVNTFGNQVAQNRNLNQQSIDSNRRYRLGTLGAATRG